MESGDATPRAPKPPPEVESAVLLGHIEEQHDELDVISPGSPLGEALVGHRPGDVVRYEAPNGPLGVKIVQVSAT